MNSNFFLIAIKLFIGPRVAQHSKRSTKLVAQRCAPPTHPDRSIALDIEQPPEIVSTDAARRTTCKKQHAMSRMYIFQ